MCNHDTVTKPTLGARKLRRLRIWDLPDQYHCSIIGTCLTLGELRRIARKAKVFSQPTATDHELHHAFVSLAGESGYATRLVQKHLDRKYKATLRDFANADREDALTALWDAAVASGEIAGAYWALVTHPKLPEGLIGRAYGEVHMMSHLSGASCRADMQALAVLRTRTEALEAQLAEQNAAAHRKAVLHKETIRTLNARLAESQQVEERLRETEFRLQAFESGERFVRLQTQADQYAALLADARAHAERADAATEDWKRLALENGDQYLRQEARMVELQSERDALESALEKMLAPDCATCENQSACGCNLDLCGRCILYVGGRDRQCARFRTLVERQNGRFLHHDGGLDNGRLRLGSILPQADAVLCPLDCVSHDAVNRVKQFCKRNGKKVVFLPRASLAAFTRGLNEVAA